MVYLQGIIPLQKLYIQKAGVSTPPPMLSPPMLWVQTLLLLAFIPRLASRWLWDSCHWHPSQLMNIIIQNTTVWASVDNHILSAMKNSSLFLFAWVRSMHWFQMLSLLFKYCTWSKNSSTLNFVRRKSSVQVDSNCDEFPVSLIPVIRL